ncbi:amino acid transporter [Cryobacterium frigoriphilum]|uniref:Amino acid transporter n=1 Tax=Cryobacterium frigoriphilum TaxID=1259150 RepID=A0A4R9A8S9_9MICO|nr:LysE family transporter [Cryobacterium frigoriphilum]TFD54004.1 amino acid transporter [Cryobacterium frigoriphilum]
MTVFDTLVPALLGLGTGLALIIAIGTQNAFVLRLGIAGTNRTIAAAVAVCAFSDAVLILAGIVGIGALVETAPGALVVIRFLGAAFLLAYGLFALVRVFRPKALVASSTGGITMKAAVLTIVALTWLNPHVYLDTLIFLGSVANQQGEAARWWWGGGAIAASFVWFTSLGFGARLLRPFFARPSSWRVLDGIIAAVMLALGVRMAIGF